MGSTKKNHQYCKMRVFSFFWKILLGVFLILVGLLPVVYFKGVTLENLELSGENTPNLESVAKSFSDRAIWSVAYWLDEDSLFYPESASRLSKVIGGEDPNFGFFTDETSLPFDSSTPTTTLFLQNSFYKQVGVFLKNTKREKVKSKLRLLDLTHYKKFYPFDSVAGAPLGASVYTVAMLDEGNWLSAKLSQELDQEIKKAFDKPQEVSPRIETFLLGLVAYGRIMDYSQLATWLGCFPNLDSFLDSENWFRRNPSELKLFYRCVQLYPEPQLLWEYLKKHGLEKGIVELKAALKYGQGAIKLLLQSQKAIYNPPSKIQSLSTIWSESFLNKGVDLANRFPNWMLLIKVLVLLLGVFLVIFAFYPKSEGKTLLRAFNVLIISILTAILLVFISEPTLMETSKSIIENKSLPYIDTNAMNTVDSQNTTLQSLDNITLYSLVFFFLIQLFVYLLGVMKVQEIKKHPVPLNKKIELLENEEPFFDIGLYLGLGGTVFSLIFLAMGIVEASLIAAYASTLFGILGVATLKVLHVRPFRKKLILQF